MNKITAPDTAVYLSDFLDQLPKGILNKKATGVGGTHLAINSKENYIIAVPTVELIQNKIYQYSDLFGIYSGITFKSFKDYIKFNTNYKILTTYDSLAKTIKWLKELGINAYDEFKLLVDEYHKILNDYSYRDRAINSLLKESLKFNYYTFLSATPINAKFVPKELRDIDYYEIEWTNSISVKPIRHKTNKPFLKVVKIIKQYKASNYNLEVKLPNKKIEYSNEVYFFVNSVKVIKDIIDNAELLPHEVKIICADTDRNKDILDPFSVNHVSDPNKPFTFVTSKSFLGVDFYSERGMTYVISNVNKKNTLLDIATDLYQIAGRIRNTNNPFKNLVFHIYNTGASDITEDEFKELVAKKIEDTNRQIRIFNSLDDLDKKATLKRYELDLEDDYSYYNPETNELEFNELKMLNEEFNYYIVNDIYTNGLSIREAYLKAGYDISELQEYEYLEEEFLNKISGYTFRDVLEEYCELIDTNENLNKQEQLIRLEPEIKDIVSKLGTSRIRSLSYSKSAINKELYKNSNEVKEAIKNKLIQQIEYNKFYTFKETKQLIQQQYDFYKLTTKAKANELEVYFNTKPVAKRIDNKVVKGYIIKC